MRFREILHPKLALTEMQVTVWSGATINVLHNPNRVAFENFAKRHEVMRGLMSYNGRDLWLWAAHAAVHSNIMQELGIAHVECILYVRGQWRGPNLHDDATGLYKPMIQRLTPAKLRVPGGPEDRDLLDRLFDESAH